jgi:molecular chaperone HscB
MSVIAAVAGNLLESDVSEHSDSEVIHLQSTDFELFQLTPKAALDLTQLSGRWKELQAFTHPDRFASSGQSATRVAMQYSIRINEAYQRLKSPISRFAYLCELNGVSIDAERNTSMPLDFLNQQMQWRETLDEACSVSDIQALQLEVDALKNSLEQKCTQSIDQQKDFTEAAKIVRSMMFVDRFQNDIDKKADLLDR